MSTNPLGQSAEYPQEYAPEVLFAIPRTESRATLGIDADLPFQGSDIWNAWDFTWLDNRGQPVAGTASFSIDADSPNIVESKSLKLYLGSFAMTRYEDGVDIVKALYDDLTKLTGLPVSVAIDSNFDENVRVIEQLPGQNIDKQPMTRWSDEVDPELLRAADETVTETLHTNLLRSLCPVTGQPDIGSLMIHYRGPRIDRSSLIDYIVSFRQHEDFHETCVERMFLDIKEHCGPDELTVYACYNRRGGIDINPFRTDFGDEPPIGRFWRQ
ncbi:MAG: NADPH-dependent 7-cyano-7-deazaguanine reductase QueF [Woeseiaceae bacterium]